MSEAAQSEHSQHPVNLAQDVPDLDIRAAIRRAFPGMLLTRSLGLSFDLNKLAIAFTGLFLLQVSWSVLDTAFLDVETTRATASAAVKARWSNAIPADPFSWASGSPDRLIEPVRVLVSPLLCFISVHPFDLIGVHAALSGLATIVVWGLFGGAISRIALVQAGWGRGLGAREALRYVAVHARPLIATPMLPVVVLVITAIFCGIFGLLFRIPWIGNFMGGLLLPIPITLGLLMFIMVAGLAAGWPLMVASVAAEGEDELDAVSRSFSYINHRMVSYLFYGGLALLIGIPGIWLVDLIASGTLLMAQWGVGLTVPSDATSRLFSAGSPWVKPADLAAASAEITGTGLVPAFWVGCVRFTARAWSFSYFWTSISLIYLMIRKDVDGAEWSQLKPDPIDEDSDIDERRFKGMPYPQESKTPEPPAAIPLSEDSDSA